MVLDYHGRRGFFYVGAILYGRKASLSGSVSHVLPELKKERTENVEKIGKFIDFV